MNNFGHNSDNNNDADDNKIVIFAIYWRIVNY